MGGEGVGAYGWWLVGVRIERQLPLFRKMPNIMKSCSPLAAAPEG